MKTMACLVYYSIFQLLFACLLWANRNELVKDRGKGVFYLLWTKENLLHSFPDTTTIEYFGFDIKNAQEVDSISTNTAWKVGEPVKAVKVPAPNPDAGVEYLLNRVNTLYPQTFWRGIHSVNMFNPSIARWKGRYIMAYRNDSDISFTWLRPIEDATHPSQFRFEPIYGDNFLSLRDTSGSHPWNSSLGLDAFREDPRLLVRRKGHTMSLTFIRLRARWDTAQIAYIDIHVPAEDHKVQFSSTTWLRQEGKQKNWMPLEYRDEQYWIVSVNPLQVAKLAATTVGEQSLEGKLNYIVHNDQEVSLPWRADYGLPIRGGTPVILVRGVYLAFFHTLSSFNIQFGTQTYFMGAITFCNDLSFHVHSMSPHPILLDNLYQGAWHNAHRDYVVFPAGLAVDDQENYVYMSFGYQDGRGFVAKFDVQELLN
ncbi:hypothetical protein EON65_56495, partial [archaeon]